MCTSPEKSSCAFPSHAHLERLACAKMNWDWQLLYHHYISVNRVPANHQSKCDQRKVPNDLLGVLMIHEVQNVLWLVTICRLLFFSKHVISQDFWFVFSCSRLPLSMNEQLVFPVQLLHTTAPTFFLMVQMKSSKSWYTSCPNSDCYPPPPRT